MWIILAEDKNSSKFWILKLVFIKVLSLRSIICHLPDWRPIQSNTKRMKRDLNFAKNFEQLTKW